MNLPYYFKKTIEMHASDLHLVEGNQPTVRVYGELKKIGDEKIPKGELQFSVFSLLDKRQEERFQRKKDIDVSMEFFDNRFRVNIHQQEGKVGLAARLVPKKIPGPEEILMTRTMYNLGHLKDGLVLVTGPTGSGKSTTLAVMLEIINQERNAHIITIEDPIEYTFDDKNCIIEQRELGRDTNSFGSALKYVLRQDPNIIMIGEIRDQETITAALNAAKTGHLVFSTLHTTTAAETIERVIDFYPSEYHTQVTHQLAGVLKAVIAQQLLPSTDGKMIVSREIMINNNAIANLIRTGKTEQIYSMIETSSDLGMVTMNHSIDELLAKGLITDEVSNLRKRDAETKTVYY